MRVAVQINVSAAPQVPSAVNWLVGEEISVLPGSTSDVATGAAGHWAVAALPWNMNLEVSGDTAKINAAADSVVKDQRAPFMLELRTNQTLATAKNLRTLATHANIQASVNAAQDGDTIEISPGLVNSANSQEHSLGASKLLKIDKHLTIRAADPADRPQFGHLTSERYAGTGYEGIWVLAPFDLGSNPRRLDVTIDGIDFANLGGSGGAGVCPAVMLRNSGTNHPGKVTIRNSRAYHVTGSHVKGSVDLLTLENIETFDCGDRGDHGAQEHNFYVGGEAVVVRGMLNFGTYVQYANHLFKCRSKKLTIDGSVIDNTASAYDALIDYSNGGELTILGSILIQRADNVHDSNSDNGMIAWAPEGFTIDGRGSLLRIKQCVLIQRAGNYTGPIVRNFGTAPQIQDVSDNVVCGTKASEFIAKYQNNREVPYDEALSSFSGTSSYQHLLASGPAQGSGVSATARYVHRAGWTVRNDNLVGLG